MKISDTASGKMKLISLILFISIARVVKSNEHYTFPPKFHPHSSGVMPTSDSSIYLPPDSHTPPMPYLPMKNENNLPYPYLPMTGTKAPTMYPTPFSAMMSSTLRPNDHDDDDDDDKVDKKQSRFMKPDRTIRSHPEIIDRNNHRSAPNHQPIDRNDKKIPYGFISNPASHPNAPVQKATARSMIISEHQRNDLFDQFKAAAAFPGPNYVPAPGASGVYLSSTTETAVPIIRLSNEMDLDGSFSYEALGADQTHYVQHSRMENTGTDKEEQVVEGSYSYVGDNGQTYTVHYIADSKGFRASGDHLPVAPPIPEIIQRAVQYNLAEEAKKPPNLKSWQNDENELSESEKYQRYIAPPSRPLFTGKTPQSFSFGFGQGAHSSQGNIISSASTQNAVNANNDFSSDQIKVPNANIPNNGGPISPQITFLATQGAHSPPANPQPSISRVFTTERPMLPQLVNYEAGAKESDQESNRALWRWQYGLNANMNQTPDKNSISRSSGEGDNVIINFSDMTPEQYTKMIRSELEPKEQNSQIDATAEHSNSMNNYQTPVDNGFNMQNGARNQLGVTTETNFVTSQAHDHFMHNNANQNHQSYQSSVNDPPKKNAVNTLDARSKLITQNDFVPRSQTVTQSYDYDESSYEPKRIVKSVTSTPIHYQNNYNNFDKINKFESETVTEQNHLIRSSTMEPLMYSSTNNNYINNYESGTQNALWSNGFSNQMENTQKITTTEAPKSTTDSKIGFNNYDYSENNSKFRPIQSTSLEEPREESTTSTQAKLDEIISQNIFLKNLFKSKKNEQHDGNKIRQENKLYHEKVNTESTEHKPEVKYMQMQPKAHNDVKEVRNPIDIMDIINYLSAKNHFESNKVKPRPKYVPNAYKHRSEVRYIPMQEDHDNENDDEEEHNVKFNVNSQRTNYYHPKELQGIIKNYKVLQRNNSAFNNGHDEQLKRNLAPPPKNNNLPPLGRAGPSTKSYLPPIYV